MLLDMLKQTWPEWQVDETPLGKGSYGAVYRAVRRERKVESVAAIKAISIPTNPAELDTLRAEGLSMDEIRTYLEGIVNDFVSEIQLMETLKGIQNIVSVEDYKVIEKTNELGWTILIRMELLTPFSAYVAGKKFTEQDVIKLGCDLCSALDFCGKRNIIHRDIKIENIFVNDFGDYKLGDFGIACTKDDLLANFTTKGTLNYMAPEMVNGGGYDHRVDIYALGVVLYRLLNGNRQPFLDTAEQLLDHDQRQKAMERRIRGEQMAPPCDASPEMAQLILRACAFNPNDRFASAQEMKQALLQISGGTGEVSYTAHQMPRASESTVLIEGNQTTVLNRAQMPLPASVQPPVYTSMVTPIPVVAAAVTPQTPAQPMAQPVPPSAPMAPSAVPTQAPSAPKSKLGLILGLVGGAVAALVAVLLLVLGGDESTGTYVPSPPVEESPIVVGGLSVTPLPQAVYAADGEIVSVTVEASGENLTYTWYVKDEGDTEFFLSSINGNTYSQTMSDAISGRLAYCVVLDGEGNMVTTDNVALRMAIVLQQQPADATASLGRYAKVSVEATGDGLTYQWYVKDVGDSDYTLSSITDSTYACEMSESTDGRTGYCVITDRFGNQVTTDTFVLGVE